MTDTMRLVAEISTAGLVLADYGVGTSGLRGTEGSGLGYAPDKPVAPSATDVNARLTMTIPEAAKRLGIGRSAAYAACKAGVLPSIKIGRRCLVPRAALERFLAGEA
jgi:excisionase family DNA binding protein